MADRILIKLILMENQPVCGRASKAQYAQGRDAALLLLHSKRELASDQNFMAENNAVQQLHLKKNKTLPAPFGVFSPTTTPVNFMLGQTALCLCQRKIAISLCIGNKKTTMEPTTVHNGVKIYMKSYSHSFKKLTILLIFHQTLCYICSPSLNFV